MGISDEEVIRLAVDAGKHSDESQIVDAISAKTGLAAHEIAQWLDRLVQEGRLARRAEGARNVLEDPLGKSKPVIWFAAWP